MRKFLAGQRLAVLASMDAEGHLWASLRSGEPGFLRALDAQVLEVAGYGHPNDCLVKNITVHHEIGMLVIDLAARNRLRVNGTAEVWSDGKILLTTKQVYGNCRKYIQSRWIVGTHAPLHSAPRQSTELDERQQDWLAQAKTFFIATTHPQSGADLSHRGGKPGFVRMKTSGG